MTEAQLHKILREEFPRLRLLRVAGSYVLSAEERELLSISKQGDQWTLYLGSGHIHDPEIVNLFTYSIAYVRGHMTAVSEYRGETLAATWFETPLGDKFGASAYLNPFDTDEWTLATGETWRKQSQWMQYSAKHARVLDDETTGDHTVSGYPLDWLVRALGPPPPDLRWTSIGTSCIVLAPAGWRADGESGGAGDMREFRNPQGPEVLRVSTFSRDAELPSGAPFIRSRRPIRIEHDTWAIDGWHADRYAAVFAGEQYDLLARIEAVWHESDPDPQSFRRLIESVVSEARYAPPNWSMEPEPSVG